MMECSIMNRVNILGISVDVIDQPDLLERIDRFAAKRRSALVNNVNVHACNLAFEQPEFRAVLNRSDIVFCDGFGVKIGAWLAGIKLGQRMTPPDWIDDLFALCVARGYRVYFIGDEPAVVERFAAVVQGRYAALEIAGWHDGFFELDDECVLAKLVSANADVIITAMGMPRQELWAAQAMDKVDKGVFIATGALFRWYTGVDRRAPRWMTDHGLEWLARLVMHPVRHFKRYGIGLPLFFLRVIRFHWFRGDLKRD